MGKKSLNIIKRKIVAPSLTKKRRGLRIVKKEPVSDDESTVNMPPPTFLRTVAREHPQKLEEDEADGCADEESASDSLVNIDAAREAIARAELDRKSSSSASDQISRAAAGHVQAVRAAEKAFDADASENTIEAAADHARTLVSGVLALNNESEPRDASANSIEGRIQELIPPVSSRVADIYNGNTGKVAPMPLTSNYKMLQQYLRDSALSTNAPIVGAMGMRVAECASALVRESNSASSALGSPLPRTIASISSPLEDSFLQKLVTQYVDNSRVPPHLNEYSEALKAMRQALPVSRRAHEELMLRPPRPGEPACSAGPQCYGNRIVCQGGGATLMAFYYEDEWAEYTSKIAREEPARLAEQDRRCLLCMRYDVNRFLLSIRGDNMQFRLEAPVGDGDTTPAIVQPHLNLVDVLGEYAFEDTNAPTNNVYEGLLYPIVKPSLRQFRRVVDHDTGDVRFQQIFDYPKNLQNNVVAPLQLSSVVESSSNAGESGSNDNRGF